MKHILATVVLLLSVGVAFAQAPRLSPEEKARVDVLREQLRQGKLAAVKAHEDKLHRLYGIDMEHGPDWDGNKK